MPNPNPSADDTGFAAFWWRWWRFVFDSWALFAALLFLILGLIGGYEMSQPDRFSTPARLTMQRLNALEDMVLKLRAKDLPTIHEERKKLEIAVTDARSAAAALPAAQNRRITPHLERIATQVEAIDEALQHKSVAYDSTLSAHLETIRAERERIRQQIDATSGVTPWFYDQAKRFLKWIGALSFLTIVAVVSLFLLMSNPRLRRFVARSSGSISAFGVSFSFSDIESSRDSIETRQRALGEDVSRTYVAALRKSGADEIFKRVYDDLEAALNARGTDLSAIDHRATFYVPDFVGENLVQASRYYGNWRQGDETVVGRRFSVRYGIIGKAWRLIKPQYNSNVRNENKNLIRNWGFTAAQAAPFASNPASGSLMAFVIEDMGNLPPLAVIYIEADGANVLHDKTLLPDADAEAQQPDADGMTAADRYAAQQIWSVVAGKRSVKQLKTALIRLQGVLRWNDKVKGAPG